MSISSERIWFYDIKGFITEKNYNKFFPQSSMTFIEQLNSLLRFAIYFCVLVFLVRHDPNIFFIMLFMAGFTYLLYLIDTQNKQREKFHLEQNNLSTDKITKKVCVKPTKDNPFMNVLMTDYNDNPNRKQACNVSTGNTKKMTKKYFANNLYRDVSDIYDTNASDRNYYTTPVTTIPSDQSGFGKFLYGQGATCKEKNGLQCYANTYRPVMN